MPMRGCCYCAAVTVGIEVCVVFGLRPLELLILVGLALLFFGPKRLPGLGKSLGSAIRDFKSSLRGDEQNASANTPATADAQHQLPQAPPPEPKPKA